MAALILLNLQNQQNLNLWAQGNTYPEFDLKHDTTWTISGTYYTGQPNQWILDTAASTCGNYMHLSSFSSNETSDKVYT